MDDRTIEALDEPAERASAIMRTGLTHTPSSFDPGRYRPMRRTSTALAWFLGACGLVLPLLSVAGVVSGLLAWRRGSRLALVAVGWCVVTAVASVAFWVPVLTSNPSTPSSPFAVSVIDLEIDVTPPAGMGFAASKPIVRHDRIRVRIANTSGSEVPLSPSSLGVASSSGERLAWSTTNSTFLTASNLPAGAMLEVELFVGIPQGGEVGQVEIAGAVARP